MAKERMIGRQKAVSDLKRELILDAARKVFEADGLEGASLRAIAGAAGYTPAALYFHFESKEAIYAEVLRCSLANLEQTINRSVARIKAPPERLRAAFTLGALGSPSSIMIAPRSAGITSSTRSISLA